MRDRALRGWGALPPVTPRLGRRGLILSALALAACGGSPDRDPAALRGSGLYPNETPFIRQRINFWARHYGIPSSIVQRIVIRESKHRPGVRNGPYYGLMQIHPQTARTMGYRGAPSGLLDADTNLRYGVKYLRGAWLVAEGDPDATVKWYSQGYYYEAKRKGLLKRTGLKS
ncbi:lytic transglycosylase domain-containing protein [Paracoccus sp. 1_MG-2023]|uniref:lytic transglycosylase domain-containing protein n=1 Tax=unclassified Paracoccus (in: a-proteobacteria) TaxID=2688777 RepID=UPI001C08B505|nr:MULTISPECIES: lytic transglycosylase domain-containing protein [unclassified Paracoccus (in: a-proteobacteria)]MBU2958523.1 lytic transglycosylase domain-containing protein [Paracoccus sp. C2R09]MDO6668492.1 lytic transglycosylase domain-containing protein [Paracoccus sp. 1_MG-2023]